MTGGKKLHGEGLTLLQWGECQGNLCLATEPPRGLSKVTNWEVAELSADLPPDFRVGCRLVSASFGYHPSRWCPSTPQCQYHHPHFTDGKIESPGDQNLNPGEGWGAPGSFLHYLHPQGPGDSLSAPADMNFCAVGSDGPISGRWPTAMVAAPYQNPSRPHLSPSQGSQRPSGLLSRRGRPCRQWGSRASQGPSWVGLPKGTA